VEWIVTTGVNLLRVSNLCVYYLCVSLTLVRILCDRTNEYSVHSVLHTTVDFLPPVLDLVPTGLDLVPLVCSGHPGTLPGPFLKPLGFALISVQGSIHG